jgi:cytochrome c
MRHIGVSKFRGAAVSAAMVAGLSAGAHAQAFKHAGCADMVEADFKLVTLVANASNTETSEPLKMDFDMDAQGNVDVYFTQRFGLLRKYSAATKTVSNLHKFTLLTGSSDGLQGIALDPAFKVNRHLYLFYTGSTTEWRVSRFTLAGSILDVASEKILLRIPMEGPSQHPGGALAFDWDGNLVITVGDNNKTIQSANTNDFRGKILRIKPKPDGSGYDIPKGNLYPPGTDKTKPEVFVMGTRNAYTLSIDPVRKAYTWGDVGPDAGRITEEHNFTKVAGNFGWPFFAGDNIRFGGGGTVEAPLNTDRANTGLEILPPAIPGIHNYKQNCAVTGPVYYFDSSLNSSVKFPPHLHGAWINGDFGNDQVWAFTLNAAGTALQDSMQLFKNMSFNNPLEFRMGPDGAFYVMNYAGYRSTSAATGLLKIEYVGPCKPPVSVAPMAGRLARPGTLSRGGQVEISAPGPHALEVKDMTGRRVLYQAGNGPAKYALESIRRSGVYALSVRTSQGVFNERFVKP